MTQYFSGTEGDDEYYGTLDHDQILGYRGDDLLLGSFGNDEIFGDEGNDELYGEGDEDYLFGGSGNDGLWGGTHEDYLEGDDGDDVLFGEAGGDQLRGEEGNDILDGGTGSDEMYGGYGNDTYFVDNSGDRVLEDLFSNGIDTVYASIDFILPDNVENLTLTGSAALTGSGNALDNIIVGNTAINALTGFDGHDTLDGGGGTDSLTGGRGNDTYVVDDAGDVVTELANEGTDTVKASIDYVLGAELENLTLAGSAAIDGTGNVRNNVIKGNSGANVLTGGVGNDIYYRGAGDSIVELANEGVDTVYSSATYRLGIHEEHLTLTGSGNTNATGNAGANSIRGNSGNNTLNGLGGADKLEGGNGNDTYIVDNAGDLVIESAGPLAAIDLVRSSISYVLTDNVEKLELTGNAANGTGNALDNTLVGNGLKNRLSGGDGRDELVGRAGNDVLSGGADADLFRFNAPGDGGQSGDAITDFVRGEDNIALDHTGFGLAGTGSLASQGVAFVVGNAATSGSKTVIFKPGIDEVWWDADGTGAGAAQRLAVLTLPAFVNLAASDLIIL